MEDRHSVGRNDKLMGTGEIVGTECLRTSGESRGKLQPLVGNVQAHMRTYDEGCRIYRRGTGNGYTFWYI